MKKRIFSMLLCLCLIAGIVIGCGNVGSSDDSLAVNGTVNESKESSQSTPEPDREDASSNDDSISEEVSTTRENGAVSADIPTPEISSPSVILIDSSTGEVLYELNSTERRSPASITKIMTLLLTFEALETGKVSLSDKVTTSEYAASVGGSQVYLMAGEIQTLDTLIKCVAVASGNDASVAVAEYIAGSEDAFVTLMNEKAEELGMVDTHFEDCSGLSDSDNQYISAKDVAIMSRELTTKYPEIFKYTTIWTENITHETAQGTSTFTLSSTNKLLKQYQWTTGLKAGSTSKGQYCISATASMDGIDLIAVVMGAPDTKTRFADAQTLLDYGFRLNNIDVASNVALAPEPSSTLDDDNSSNEVAALSDAKLLRSQDRAKERETLLEIINSEKYTEEQKQAAVDAMVQMTAIAEKEAAAEILLEAKGFKDVMVSINGDTVDVVVNTVALDNVMRAQIEDIVSRKTEISAENIVISTVVP